MKNELNHSEIIELMQVYLNEWMHRDETFWSRTHKYFYSTLVVMLLPSLTDWIRIELPEGMINDIFPIVGIIMAIVFIYFTITLGKRAIIASNIYRDLIKMLPNEYREVNVNDQEDSKILGMQMSLFLPTIMFVFLILFGIILFLWVY